MTAPETRWTAETEGLLVARNHEAECGGPIEDCVFLPEHGIAAREALEVLADAGLLLPPGGETSQHAEVEYRQIGRTRGGVDEKTYLNWSAEQRGLEFEAALELGYEVLSERTRSVVDWPDGSKLTGPWIEVPS